MARFTMLTPILLSTFKLQLVECVDAAGQGYASAGTIPSSTAARVACIASSTRAFFSFISVSVAAPTLITVRLRPASPTAPATSRDRSRWWSCRSVREFLHAALHVAGLAFTFDDMVLSLSMVIFLACRDR